MDPLQSILHGLGFFLWHFIFYSPRLCCHCCWIFLCSWSVFCLSVLMCMPSYYFQKLNFEHSHCIPNFLRKSRNTTTIILMKTQTNKSIKHLHDSERQRDIHAHVKEWHLCLPLFFVWYPPAFIPSYVTAYFPSLSRLGKKYIFKGTWSLKDAARHLSKQVKSHAIFLDA